MRKFAIMIDSLIYFDNNATTRIDPRVLEEMMPYLTNTYSNAASTHLFGTQAHEAVKKARAQIAELIGSETKEIVFTSGATEAINLAIKGIVEAYSEKGKHIITCLSEHSAVLDTCRHLEKKGYEVTYLPVETDGLIDLDLLKTTIREDTVLVSIMFVNNETGVIQPIKEIAEIAHTKGAFFMTDGTQAVGKVPIDVKDIGTDLMAFSGHKYYGPKGVGGLYIRGRGPFKVKINAMIHGGGQESGIRSGTLNVPGIVGIGKASEIAIMEMHSDAKRVGELRSLMEQELLKTDNSFVNGHLQKRLFNVSNICFSGADADAILVGIQPIIASNGSACSSASIEPSHVLIAMGLSTQQAFSSLRLSLGRYTTMKDVEAVIQRIPEIVLQLRQMSV